MTVVCLSVCLFVPCLIISQERKGIARWTLALAALCGLQGCKNRPALFPGRMSYKATKPGLVSVLYLSIRYTVLLFIRAHFYVSFRCYVFCLLVVLVKLSVLAKWLTRKAPLKNPNRGGGSSLESPGRRVRMIFLVYYIASLFYYVFVLSPTPTWYNFLLLWRDTVFENTYFMFFSDFKKTWLFTFFWNDVSKSRKKSLAKV